MDGCGRVAGWLDGWMDGWMDRWIDGVTEGWFSAGNEGIPPTKHGPFGFLFMGLPNRFIPAPGLGHSLLIALARQTLFVGRKP